MNEPNSDILWYAQSDIKDEQRLWRMTLLKSLAEQPVEIAIEEADAVVKAYRERFYER